MTSASEIFEVYEEPCPECGDWGIKLFNITDVYNVTEFDAQCNECGEVWHDYITQSD